MTFVNDDEDEVSADSGSLATDKLYAVNMNWDPDDQEARLYVNTKFVASSDLEGTFSGLDKTTLANPDSVLGRVLVWSRRLSGAERKQAYQVLRRKYAALSASSSFSRLVPPLLTDSRLAIDAQYTAEVLALSPSSSIELATGQIPDFGGQARTVTVVGTVVLQQANGIWEFYFDGESYLQITVPQVSGEGAVTVAAAGRTEYAAENYGYHAVNLRSAAFGFSQQRFAWNNGHWASQSLGNNDYRVYSARYDSGSGGTVKTARNGSQVSSDSYSFPLLAATTLRIGANFDASDFFIGGINCAQLAYSADQTEQEDWHSDIATRFGF